MKIFLLNTPSGLKPLYDDDFSEKKKLKIGETYVAEIKLVRNPKFHALFMALVNLSWEYLDERNQKGFKNNKELWRKYLICTAGFVDVFWSPKLHEYVEYPKSISWDKMDEAEFHDLYDRVRDIVFSIIGNKVSREEFEAILTTFS
jgi:hypothetical protein